jgi:hypothetical protein
VNPAPRGGNRMQLRNSASDCIMRPHSVSMRTRRGRKGKWGKGIAELTHVSELYDLRLHSYRHKDHHTHKRIREEHRRDHCVGGRTKRDYLDMSVRSRAQHNSHARKVGKAQCGVGGGVSCKEQTTHKWLIHRDDIVRFLYLPGSSRD